jgi:hypothetical protein
MRPISSLTSIQILLGAAFAATVIALIMGSTNATALTTVCGLAIIALILLVVLPSLTNTSRIKLGVTGFEIQRLADAVDRQGKTINEQEERLIEQQKIINDLVTYSLSEDAYNILWRIKNTPEYIYRDDKNVQRWANTLLDHGYIEPVMPGFRLVFDDYMKDRNLVGLAKPTPAGDFMIKLRGKPAFADF